MNPKDAAGRSLRHGPTPCPSGVVASEKGAWLMTSLTGQTISALVSADLKADIAEGACFNDTPVEVSRVTS
jgi:hypothetical protein